MTVTKRFKVEQVSELKGHNDRVWALSWSPSQPFLSSCSTDKSIRIYSYRPSTLSSSSPSESTSTAPVFQLQSTIPTSHTRTVRNLAFSPTGKVLATASFDSTVGLWMRHGEEEEGEDEEGGGAAKDEEDGEGEWEPMDALEGHESEVKDVQWSRDGRWVASCGRDKSVWVWEVIGPSEFECAAVLMEHSQDVKSLSWHPTEELLASASYDDTLSLYRPSPYDDEWVILASLKSHSGTVWSCSFSPCGEYLASTGDDLSVKIWGRVQVDRKGEVVATRGDQAEGEDGKGDEDEGGRMGPWSNQHGSEIREKTKWILLGDLKASAEASGEEEVKEGDEEKGSGFERSCYSLDWGRHSSDENSLGRIVVGSGDGTLRVWELSKPLPSSSSTSLPPNQHLLTIHASHGVSDVNSVKWCTYDPYHAEKVRVALEGGDERVVGVSEGEAREKEREAVESTWASAGDDGVVRVWRVVEA